ncbi:MAG: DUF1080 domain-containing protein [Planctomycetes bacterium]|nr:DUF1080 domain-containing protein [Planctomycetota bacterium]
MQLCSGSIVLVLASLVATVAHAADEQQVFVSLFNGKNLSGFRVPQPNPWWTVKNGVLVGVNDTAKKGIMLWTDKLYQDVIVEVEFRFTGEIDSGVMLRQPEIQAQIGVSRSLKKDMTGSIYAHGKYPKTATGIDKLLKVGDWNTMRFQAKGSTYDVWLNGQHVLNYGDKAFPDPAPIGLQIHGGVEMKIEFRSIKAAALNEVPSTATWNNHKR